MLQRCWLLLRRDACQAPVQVWQAACLMSSSLVMEDARLLYCTSVCLLPWERLYLHVINELWDEPGNHAPQVKSNKRHGVGWNKESDGAADEADTDNTNRKVSVSCGIDSHQTIVRIDESKAAVAVNQLPTVDFLSAIRTALGIDPAVLLRLDTCS